MAFRTQDLPKTIRRDKRTGSRRLYPRLLRDDSIKPQIGIAIRFFETKLGLLRRELEPDVLIQLFGDPRLARCLVSCLARAYRYRTRRFADLIGEERAAALAARGLHTPRDLRALAFAKANEQGGFVAPTDRATFLDTLVPELDLVEAEQALWLDAPDQAILIRVGPVPTVEEVLALYHLRLIESLLRIAPLTTLAVRGDRAQIEAVCARYGVRATIEKKTVMLHGKQDAIGSWSRHGGRVARAALTLIGLGLLGAGAATVALGDERFDVNLDAATLALALPQRGWAAPESAWPDAERLMTGIAAERRQGHLAGWRLRRWPEPQVTEEGTLWPEFTISRGTIAIGLLPLTAAQVRADADALLALAERVPFIVLVKGALRAIPVGLTVLRLDSETVAADLAGYLDRTFPLDAATAAPEWLTSLAASARADGSLAESELARRLDCQEEAVADRLVALAEPDLVYIDGFGLCADPFLARARTLYDEELARNGGRLDLGILGRRLRTLVGRNEGLHALIAQLGGELRAVA
jgi:predicted nuclease of restriction endonuclease-like RecB superfamily